MIIRVHSVTIINKGNNNDSFNGFIGMTQYMHNISLYEFRGNRTCNLLNAKYLKSLVLNKCPGCMYLPKSIYSLNINIYNRIPNTIIKFDLPLLQYYTKI